VTSHTYTLAELEKLSGFNARTIVYYIAEGLLPKVGRRGRHTRYPEEVLLRLRFIGRVRALQDAGRLRPVTLSEIREVIDGLDPVTMGELAAEDSDEEAIRALFEEPDVASVAGQPYAAAEKIAEDRSGMLSASARLAQRRRQLERRTTGYEDADFLLAETSPAYPDPGPTMVREEESDFLFEARRRAGSTREQAGRAAAEPLGRLFLKGLRAAGQTPASDEELELIAELKTILAELEQRAREEQARGVRSARERMVRVPLSENIALTLRNIRDDDELVDRLTEILRRLGR